MSTPAAIALEQRGRLQLKAVSGMEQINPDDPDQMKKLDQIVNIRHAAPLIASDSIESNEEIRQRLSIRQNLIITDDNMGVEWR